MVVRLPQFAQKAWTDKSDPLGSSIRNRQGRQLSSSRSFSSRSLSPASHEDEVDQPSVAEVKIPEKHNQSPGFSLADIRIFQDSGQSRGRSSPGRVPPLDLAPLWPVQARLVINQPGDRYEQEADRIADQVMRMPEPGIVSRSEIAGPLLMKRSCPKCKKKARKRQDEEELLQMKPVSGKGPKRSAAKAAPSSVPPIVHEVLRSSGKPLDESTQSFMEPRFGHDFGKVRIHSDAKAAKAAQEVNSMAYTIGQNVVFGAGQYSPETKDGQKLLAHELAHVIQQMEGAQGNKRSGYQMSSQIIQRRIICDENGENCQSIPDEIPEEPPASAEEENYTPADNYTPVPEEEESYTSDLSSSESVESEANMADWDLSETESGDSIYPASSREDVDSIPEPRSLNQTLDSSTLTIAELESEIDAIRRWLNAHPEYGPEQEQLQASQAVLENELTTRLQQGVGLHGISAQRMAPCPPTLNASDPVPPGWRQYPNNPWWFHCGYRGILEDRPPSPEDPMNECFYDDNGALVDEHHIDAGCRGTPDQYDSTKNRWEHFWSDEGGIRKKGLGAFWSSRLHYLGQEAENVNPRKER